jgi:hypothetical protein
MPAEHRPGRRRTTAGRFTKRTPELVTALCDVLRIGGTRTAALAHVGVDWSTFYNWLDRDPEFAGTVARAEADAELRYLTPVAQASQSGDWRAAAFWLERRRWQEWGPRQVVDQNVHVDMAALMREHLVRKPDALPPSEPPPSEPTIIDLPPPHTNGTADRDE